MKKALLFALFIAVISSGTALAAETGKEERVLKLLEITNARSTVDQVAKSIEGFMQQQIQATARDLPPEGQEAMEIVRRESTAWLSENLSWDQLKGMYVDVYSEVFTEKEIDQLIRFYQSPLGQKILAKMPELLQACFQRSQALVKEKLPEFQERLKKRLEEVEAKYKKGEAQEERPSDEP